MAPYSGPVIDTHHHIWLRKDVAWLADPPIPRMFGDYFGLRRDYPVEEWINDVVPQGVTKSVHVTANWGLARALDETRWLQSVADKHGYPHGIVCQVDLADPDIDAKLKAQKQFPNLRGVRQMLYWDADPVRQAVNRPTSAIPPNFAADLHCWKSTALVSNCRCMPGRRPTQPSWSRRFPMCA
jgi:predicted TIM-barrel fold metal-dependent hydrolase